MKKILILLPIIFLLSLLKSYSQAGMGKEFYFAFPAMLEQSKPLRANRIYITSTKKTEVKIWTGSLLKKTITTIPNDVVTVDLLPLEGQLFTKNETTASPRDSLYVGKAVHIRANDPIAVYAMNIITGMNEGMVVYPTTQCGSDYIVSAAQGAKKVSHLYGNQLILTGFYNQTHIFITLPKHVNTASRDSTSDRTYQITLNKGDVYTTMADDETSDFSGTIISSSRPIGVITGTQCAVIPADGYRACNFSCEMLTPITHTGKNYLIHPFPNRIKGDYFKIFALEDSTDVQYNDVMPVRINRYNNDLEKNQSWFAYSPINPNPALITANKPIQILQISNCRSLDDVPSGPFTVTQTATDLFQKHYIVYVGEMPNNYIYLICDSLTSNDIEYKNGEIGTWKKVTNLNIVKRTPFNNGWLGLTFKVASGVYQFKGDKAFTGYVTGYADSIGYGYPFLNNIKTGYVADTVNPEVKFTEANCRTGVWSATVTDMPSNDTFRINLSHFEVVANTNFRFSPDQIDPGFTTTANYSASVIDLKRDAQLIVGIYDYNGNGKVDTITYKAAQLSSVSSLDIGLKTSADPIMKNVKIKNENIGNVSFNVALANGNKGFKINSAKTISLPIAQTSDVVIEYSSDKVGVATDTLVATDDCGLIIKIPLTAKTLTPSEIGALDLDYGSVYINELKTEELIISNNATGESILSITNIASPGDNGAFTFAEAFPQYPINIDNGKSFKVKITFKPQIEKKYIDSVVITSNSITNGSNKYTAILLGTGVLRGDAVYENLTGSKIDASIINGNLKILFESKTVANLQSELFDINGKLISKFVYNNLPTSGVKLEDVSNLPNGVYYLKVNINSKFVGSIKLIKE